MGEGASRRSAGKRTGNWAAAVCAGGLALTTLLPLGHATPPQTPQNATAPTPKTRWEGIRRDQGVVTWQGIRPDRELPLFRARTVIPAGLWRVLAVLEDIDRACAWTANCAEMRVLQRVSHQELIVYARMDAPWPVEDRDVITRVQAVYGPGDAVTIRIRSEASDAVAVRDGVTRMPRLDATYRLQPLDAGRTQIDYIADVDAGGLLPQWLRHRIAREFPHNTLSRLTLRLREMGRDERLVRRADELARKAAQSGYVAAKTARPASDG